jgi:hypothetical protein
MLISPNSVHPPSFCIQKICQPWYGSCIGKCMCVCVNIVMWLHDCRWGGFGFVFVFVFIELLFMTTLYRSLSHTDWGSQSRSSLRFMLAASISSGFPNCPQPQLPVSATHNDWTIVAAAVHLASYCRSVHLAPSPLRLATIVPTPSKKLSWS